MTQKPQSTCPYCQAEVKINRGGNTLYACGTTFSKGSGSVLGWYVKGGSIKFKPTCLDHPGYGCDTCAFGTSYEELKKHRAYCNKCQVVACADPESATPEQCRKCYWVMPKERR